MTHNQTILEKYQPKTIESLKLPERIMSIIDAVQNRQGYRLLLYGQQGTGKTTTARLLNNDKDKFDVLYLSGSNDFNIQTLREKIYPFAGSHSVLKKQKTIIIDEAENMKDVIQDAFKIVLDASKKVNFIFITNEIEKIIPPVQSRFTKIEYNFNEQELVEQRNNYLMYIKNIVDTEKIEYDNTGIKELYIRNFPDFRQSLVVIQQIIDGKQKLTRDTVIQTAEQGVQDTILYDILLKEHDAQKFYEACSGYKSKEKEAINSLAEPFFRYLNSIGKFEQTIKSAIVVAKYSNMYSTATSKFGTFFAMMSELRTIFR